MKRYWNVKMVKKHVPPFLIMTDRKKNYIAKCCGITQVINWNLQSYSSSLKFAREREIHFSSYQLRSPGVELLENNLKPFLLPVSLIRIFSSKLQASPFSKYERYVPLTGHPVKLSCQSYSYSLRYEFFHIHINIFAN